MYQEISLLNLPFLRRRLMSVFLHPEIKQNPARLLRMLICVLGIILLTAACNTNPPKQTATAEAATNDSASNTLADNNKEELVCHYVMGTGSNIPRKVCAYEKTWEKYNEKSRENAEELTRKTRETGALTAPMSPAEQSVGRGTVAGPMSP